MGKVYFLSCDVVADKGITRWQAVRSALQQFPDIDSYPSILRSANIIKDFLADKPQAWQMGSVLGYRSGRPEQGALQGLHARFRNDL
jgi:hypothetical protein